MADTPSDGSFDGSPVTVATFGWEMEANLARARLASAGIAAHLADECMGSIYWHYVKALGGLRLQVSAEDAEDALAILREPIQEETEATGPVVANAVDEKADRALRAAVFGIFALPLELYAFWLLINIFASKERLGRKARRKVLLASVLNLPLVLITAVGLHLLSRG